MCCLQVLEVQESPACEHADALENLQVEGTMANLRSVKPHDTSACTEAAAPCKL
jgi:hypothetical protein